MIPTAETPPPNDRPRALAVVPARLASTRLPRKMLLAETGACLFVHTAENAARSGAFEEVLVAADSDEVMEAAQAAGLSCVSTDPECPSGTDRVFEALEGAGAEYEVVVGVQGDEPELNPEDLDKIGRASCRERPRPPRRMLHRRRGRGGDPRSPAPR